MSLLLALPVKKTETVRKLPYLLDPLQADPGGDTMELTNLRPLKKPMPWADVIRDNMPVDKLRTPRSWSQSGITPLGKADIERSLTVSYTV